MAQTSSLPKYRHGTYSDLASEYYDSRRHPTSANFREASQYLRAPWLLELLRPWSRVLEIGAGRSVVAELLADSGQSPALFVVSDLSPEMLSYTPSFLEHPPSLCLCDAELLPFASNSFDLIVSSLGDPYNTVDFWQGVARVVCPEGYVVFTTPSFEWAKQFRNGTNLAEFVIADGGAIVVKSCVEEVGEQRRMIERSGLTIMERRNVFKHQLHKTPLSPKLRTGPIVSGYLARKDMRS